ncbi:ATP-binding protein [Streptomyces sp. M19]
MHTLLGLLELGLHEEAVEFVTEAVGGHRATAEQVTERVHDPLLAALLVGKATVAAERGVALRVAEDTLLPDRLVDPPGLVTVVGNLVDNAMDAAAGSRDARVEVRVRTEDRTVVLTVGDTGPGPRRPARPGLHRGLVDQGAARARQARHRAGAGAPPGRAAGRQRAGGGTPGRGAEFTVVLPEALADPRTAPGPPAVRAAAASGDPRRPRPRARPRLDLGHAARLLVNQPTALREISRRLLVNQPTTADTAWTRTRARSRPRPRP